MAFRQNVRSIPRRARVQMAPAKVRSRRRRRGKPTIYRYRRGIPALWRAALVGAVLLLAWWLALSMRGERAAQERRPQATVGRLFGPFAATPTATRVVATPTATPAPLPMTGGPS